MLYSASLLALLLPAVLAHPGHSIADEAAERAAFFKLKPRTVGDCANTLKARDRFAANVARRSEWLKSLRAGLRMKKRSYDDYNFSHEYTGGDIDLDTDYATLFAENTTCTLQPDVTQGPYYVSGEYIRQDIREDQEGVPVYLDLQIIDTSTCEPVSDLYFDLWHANATGVYSGIVASGNGDSSDSSNIDTTFLRGIQQTDSDGIVQFITIVPGHYTSRAPHIHILSHSPDSITVLDNGTLSTADGTTASHVGQLFFDQDLLTEVGEISPYTENTQDLTLNADDQILASEAESVDPFVEYTLLGDDLSDGILAWISIGIDSSEESTINAAATLYESGGVANSDSGSSSGGGGGGSSGGNGTGSAPPDGGPSANSTSIASNGTATATSSTASSSTTSTDASTTTTESTDTTSTASSSTASTTVSTSAGSSFGSSIASTIASTLITTSFATSFYTSASSSSSASASLESSGSVVPSLPPSAIPSEPAASFPTEPAGLPTSEPGHGGSGGWGNWRGGAGGAGGAAGAGSWGKWQGGPRGAGRGRQQ